MIDMKKSNIEDFLVNYKYGIIKDMIEVESIEGFPKVYRIKAHKQNIKNIINFQENDNDGYGYSFCHNKAIQSALGEAVERYCSSYIPKKLLIEKYNKLKKDNINVINPNMFIHKFKKYKKINLNTKIGWKKAYNVFNNKEVYVPASIIYLPIPRNNGVFPQLRDQNSTGLATGVNIEHAIMNGIYECIERDSFAIMWYNKLNGDYIAIEELDKKNQDIIKKFNDLGLEIILKQINYKTIIPVYLAIMLNKKYKKLPKIYICTKSGSEFNKTIYDLLGELIGGYYSLIELKYIYNLKIHKELKNVRSLEENALTYGFGNIDLNQLEFLLRKSADNQIERKRRLNDKENTLEEILCEIKNMNINMYFSEITTPDISSIGLKVVRVFSPELCFLESNYKDYNNKRININNVKNETEHPFS